MKTVEDLIDAIEAQDAMIATELLNNFPQLAVERFGDEQPLHCAIRAENREVINQLLQIGADVNSIGNNGETPLHYAIRTRQEDIVETLLNASAIPTIPNNVGIPPLLLAARSGESSIADQLIQSGITLDLHSAAALGRVSDAKTILEVHPESIRQTLHKNDLLTDAIYANSSELVELLLQSPDIDVNSIGLSGESPLLAALGSSETNPSIVRLLLEHGADPTRPDRHGQTPLARAKCAGTLRLLEGRD